MEFSNDQIKALAQALLKADKEQEVIEILTRYKFWDDPKLWRLYGDKEGNFAQIGNQQSLQEAALVEKVINSVDTRLMLECKKRHVEPESPEAPVSIRDAIATYFEDRRSKDDEAGKLINWPQKQKLAEARNITIAATGSSRKPRNMCLTIYDNGEGQSPNSITRTILSLNAKNKQRIRFVQGKFNMGGSGALRFCGEHGIQLVITKRNSSIPIQGDETSDLWAVTVVRREEPTDEAGSPVHSEFTYLAPL